MRRPAVSIFFSFLITIALCGIIPAVSQAGEVRDTATRAERAVSLQVVDVPLNEVLSILAKNIPIEIKGTVALQERVTVQFSNLTLEEALSRIMRGYNYVLVRPEESAKAVLVVINKIERAIQSEQRASGGAKAPAVSVPASAAATRDPATQAGLPATQQASPPKTHESLTAAPGATAAPGGTTAGEVVQQESGVRGESQSTQAASPQAPERSAPRAASAVPSQQPLQQNREPVSVMTPFGERIVEPPEAGPNAPVQGPQQHTEPDKGPSAATSSPGQP
jgi:hypothetical protein